MKFKEYLGILLGGIYGLVFRVLGGFTLLDDFFSIYSLTFIVLIPLLVGLLPLLIARKEIENSMSKQFFYPFLSALTFIILAMSMRLEDFFCILILGLPFLAGAGTVGLMIGVALKNKKDKHKKDIHKKLYSLFLLPLFLTPMEMLIQSPKNHYEVKRSITIDRSSAVIWKNIIEVPEISDDEYDYGFFNAIGIPRPVKSQLEMINGKQYRVGYFSDELKLVESIAAIDTLNYVSFAIDMNKSQLRDIPMDNHILKSTFFQFNRISYQISEITADKVVLSLTCTYSIESNINAYANFWAELVIEDFETKLLGALKGKIERE